jgi:hypothetical protein
LLASPVYPLLMLASGCGEYRRNKLINCYHQLRPTFVWAQVRRNHLHGPRQ